MNLILFSTYFPSQPMKDKIHGICTPLIKKFNAHTMTKSAETTPTYCQIHTHITFFFKSSQIPPQ